MAMAMTKKQAAVWFRRESTTRTRSLFHHDVILILVVSIMFCHQSTIDAFCSNGNPNPNPRHYCCGIGRKTDGNLLYQRPCQFQFHKKQHSLSTIHHTPTTKTVSLQGFFGGMFGGGDDDAKGDEKDAVLVTYDIEQFDGNANDNANDIDVKFESLSDYITNKWAMLFVTGTIPLTTPVRLSKNPATSTKSSSSNATDRDDGDKTVEDVAGCRLIFQKVDTGYKSSKEEDNATGGGDDGTGTGTTTSVDRKETKQGGVEIVVEKISSSLVTPRSLLRVRARRCEIDDDTMIKEMSEDIIVEELRKAIDVWKKERVV